MAHPTKTKFPNPSNTVGCVTSDQIPKLSFR